MSSDICCTASFESLEDFLAADTSRQIADTRKIDRAVGKTRINSSNKDALELYLLINGSNKKFVNYLLKKRNIDNTRMFEVKNIIEIVKNFFSVFHF